MKKIFLTTVLLLSTTQAFAKINVDLSGWLTPEVMAITHFNHSWSNYGADCNRVSFTRDTNDETRIYLDVGSPGKPGISMSVGKLEADVQQMDQTTLSIINNSGDIMDGNNVWSNKVTFTRDENGTITRMEFSKKKGFFGIFYYPILTCWN
jgi:hypothetical protein